MAQSFNKDHPGYSDPAYRQRRDEIASYGIGYKMGDKIVDIEYTDEENKLWSQIYLEARPELLKHGCQIYIENFNNLEEDGIFTSHKIP